MVATSSTLERARCVCGCVELEMRGAPILVAACYCDDCQEAARQIEQLPGAMPVMASDGGTSYLLYRKDRMTCAKGVEFLHDYRLKPASPTRRVMTRCCNSTLYLDFEKGHWYSIHRANFEGNVPPVEMQIQTKFKPRQIVEDGGVPAYSGYPLTFMMKLLIARLAMLFQRRPSINANPGQL